MTITIVDVGTGTRHACSVMDLLRDNPNDETIRVWALTAQPGDVLDLGGGAAPHVRLVACDHPSLDLDARPGPVCTRCDVVVPRIAIDR